MKEAKTRPMKVITRMTKVLIFLQKNIDETQDDDEDQHQKRVTPVIFFMLFHLHKGVSGAHPISSDSCKGMMPFSDSSSLLRYSRIHGLLLRLEDVISLLCKTLRKGQGATGLEEDIEIDLE